MKKQIIRLIALILIVVIPFSAFVIFTECLEDTYKNTYLGAFEQKYELLKNADGKKIIFISGSSLPFGVRSELIENELGGEYTVINFGLYATLGTKFMMDMARPYISEGDIVILCPELSEQTYSLYFNAEAVLQASNGLSPMLNKLSAKDKLSIFYNYYKYAFEKIKYTVNGNAPDPIGIYRSDSFNERGDLEFERENNIMNNGYDSNMLIKTDSTLLNTEFIDYVNEYIAYSKKVGAEIYFNYSPVNCLAIRSSKAARAEFESALSSAIDCELLGTIEDYIIDERYFYDTNFHLNSAGAVYFSRMLAISLKQRLGMDGTVSLEIPEPPELAEDEVIEAEPTDTPIDFNLYLGEPNNDYAEYFHYSLTGNTYTIIGVKDEYLGMKEVILPSTHEGKNVSAVASFAFDGCVNLERVHVGLTYKSLAVSAFDGCISLERIYLYETDGNRLSPPPEGLLNGTPEDVKICIPKGSNYASGYTWSYYIGSFEFYSKGGAK